jgi:hypothetical protein
MKKQTILTVAGLGYCVFLNYMYFKTVKNDIENKFKKSLQI